MAYEFKTIENKRLGELDIEAGKLSQDGWEKDGETGSYITDVSVERQGRYLNNRVMFFQGWRRAIEAEKSK